MLGEPGLGLDYDSKVKTLNHFMAFILKQHPESTSNLELLKVNFGLSNWGIHKIKAELLFKIL